MKKKTNCHYKKRKHISFAMLMISLGFIFFAGFSTLIRQNLIQSIGSEKDFQLFDATIVNASSDDSLDTESQVAEKQEDWKLILVNRWNPIPQNYSVELTELSNGHAVDSRIYPELQKMFDDARAQGILPTITSSYRTTEDQQALLDEEIADYEAQGYTKQNAKEIAEKWVAIPGTSEHQIGMAVDISTVDSSQQDASVVWAWLKENCYKYGFILRYPEDKTEITGVMFEPWHFRYVGKEAAKEIFEQDICLEQYINKMERGDR